MGKRFTDTDKWKDEWFTDLEPAMKIFWIYICDNCDIAGVWKVNFKIASSMIGTILDKQSTLKAFGKRVRVIADDRWFIEKFISFQQPKGLSSSCKAHIGIINSLKQNGIDPNPYLTVLENSSKDSTGIGIGIGKSNFKNEEEGEKILSADSSKDFSNSKEIKLAGIKTPDDLIKYWLENLVPKGFPLCPLTLGGTNRDRFFEVNKLLSENGTTWLAYVQRIEASDFLMNQKQGGKPTITWLFKDSNLDDVLSGKYDESGNSEDIYSKIKDTPA